MNMKPIAAFILATSIALTLTACGGGPQSESVSTSDKSTQTTQPDHSQIQKTPNGGEATSGRTEEFEYKIDGNAAVITKYLGPEDVTSITVPNEFEGYPVVKIGDNYNRFVFSGLKNLEHIDLPDSLQEISYRAFGSCTKLKTVELPDSLTTMEESCFADCGLEAITIPSNVKSLGPFAFDNCSSLADVTLQNGLETIEAYAFNDCNQLSKIEFPESLKKIKDGAFSSTGLVSVSIPENIEEMGAGVFRNCKRLEQVYLNNHPTLIPDDTFYYCEALSYVEGLNKTEEIGNKAFWGCSSLRDIGLYDGLKIIGEQAFAHCTELMSIIFPSTVEYIGREAFVNCENFNVVVLSDSIKTIEIFAFCINGVNGSFDTELYVYNLSRPLPEMENAFPNGTCFFVGMPPSEVSAFRTELESKNPASRFQIENNYVSFN